MIRQIFGFSRQPEFERQTLDLLPLLKEEVKLLRQTLPENMNSRSSPRPASTYCWLTRRACSSWLLAQAVTQALAKA